jgi:Flp pilus assembly protein TadG
MISRLKRRDEAGQALIEFALVAVFLVLLVVGFLELTLVMHTYNVLADSAKEGVRYAIVHGAANAAPSGPGCSNSCAAACNAICGAVGTGVVKTYAQASLHDTTAMTVLVDYNPGGNNGAGNCNKSPCLVRVTVSYPYTFFNLGWTSINVNAAAQGRIVY